MLKKFSCTVVLIPFIILLNGAMLAVEVIMLRAGTGSINNPEKLPYYAGWYAVLIDTNEYKYGENDPYGLPDSHDFSKRKDFFAIFPSVYCSGTKKPGRKDGYGDTEFTYEADYCSPWGSHFDLQWLWRVWGVDLIENGYIGQNPRMIWITVIAGACATALSTVLKLIGFCFFWSKAAALIVSWVSMACLCAMSVMSQMFVGNLVSGASKLKVGGTGHIEAQYGYIHTRCAWILTATSCAGALVETFIFYRQYKHRRARRSASPTSRGRINVVGGGGRGGVYQHLAAGGKEGLHAESHIELIHSSSRAPSREPSPMRGGYGDGGKKSSVSVTVQESSYEPMRHRDIG